MSLVLDAVQSLLTDLQRDATESKFHACSGEDRRRVEAVSVVMHSIGALDHVRPIHRLSTFAILVQV